MIKAIALALAISCLFVEPSLANVAKDFAATYTITDENGQTSPTLNQTLRLAFENF